jgi:hypothetical protein
MKNLPNRLKSLMLTKKKFSIFTLFISIAILLACTSNVRAEIETSFLFSLSNFNGPIGYTSANIAVDAQRNEIFILGSGTRDVRVFNEHGMEIYRFNDDDHLNSAIDLAVKEDGNVFVLSRNFSGSRVFLYNFRGEYVSGLEFKNFPPDFSAFSADRLVYRGGLLYLLDSNSMRIAVTDADCSFRNGYDLRLLTEPFIRDKRKTEVVPFVGGFSVDREGNMLFTVPTYFYAFKLSPDRQIVGFGDPGSSPGRFAIAGGIVADGRDHYYVADRLRSVVLIFDKDFHFLKEFGYRGYRSDNLIGPNHLALDSQGRLYISQLRDRGVSVFQVTYK